MWVVGGNPTEPVESSTQKTSLWCWKEVFFFAVLVTGLVVGEQYTPKEFAGINFVIGGSPDQPIIGFSTTWPTLPKCLPR